MTSIDTRPVVDPQLDEGDDDDRYSHYVRKEDIMRSAVDGVPVKALCGKTWLPGKDPEKFPVCPQCKDMMGMLEAMMAAGGTPNARAHGTSRPSFFHIWWICQMCWGSMTRPVKCLSSETIARAIDQLVHDPSGD